MTAAVFFDLDGTLADTAPDLAWAINHMRAVRGMPELPLAVLRPVTSAGARGMLGVGFNITPDQPGYEPLRQEFLDLYAGNLCKHTRLFPGMPELLTALDGLSLPWGIVTNKAERLAVPLLEALGLRSRAACIIGGDTTPHLKPHPASLLLATERTGHTPAQCLYVGDDLRDVGAARAAGMPVVVAGFGYFNGSDPSGWGADAIIAAPMDLLAHL